MDDRLKTFEKNFPNVHFEPLPESDEEAKEKFKKENFGFTREDLAENDAYIGSPVGYYKKSIEIFGKYIRGRELEALIAASAVCRAEDEERDNLASQMHISLVNVYGELGKRIYNRLRSETFNEIFIPFVREIEVLFPEDPMLRAKIIRDFYNQFMEELTDRIFVSDKDDRNSIQSQLWTKFTKFNVKSVYVFARKPRRVAVAEVACKTFIENREKDFELKMEEYKLRKEIAKKFTIRKKRNLKQPENRKI